MGSKRAVGDDIEEMADSVHTYKRSKPCRPDIQKKIAAYLNGNKSKAETRDLCSSIGCACTYTGHSAGEGCGECRAC